MYCKRLLQVQNLHGVFTACTRRANNAPTALTQRPHIALSNTSMLKINATAWCSRRLHSAHIALLAIAQRAPRRFAFVNAVGTL